MSTNEPATLQENNDNNSNIISPLKKFYEPNTNDKISSIYLYKNDPKVINKGIRITDVRGYQSGYFPQLSERDYHERKYTNTSYKYDTKLDHGTRPMHKSNFSISQSNPNDYSTNNKIVIIFVSYLVGNKFSYKKS
jgi:hypothetical protein